MLGGFENIRHFYTGGLKSVLVFSLSDDFGTIIYFRAVGIIGFARVFLGQNGAYVFSRAGRSCYWRMW